MFRFWCEWDFGQEDLVFASETSAIKWFNENEAVIEMFNDVPAEQRHSFKEPFQLYCCFEGLAGLVPVTFIN